MHFITYSQILRIFLIPRIIQHKDKMHVEDTQEHNPLHRHCLDNYLLASSAGKNQPTVHNVYCTEDIMNNNKQVMYPPLSIMMGLLWTSLIWSGLEW